MEFTCRETVDSTFAARRFNVTGGTSDEFITVASRLTAISLPAILVLVSICGRQWFDCQPVKSITAIIRPQKDGLVIRRLPVIGERQLTGGTLPVHNRMPVDRHCDLFFSHCHRYLRQLVSAEQRAGKCGLIAHILSIDIFDRAEKPAAFGE